MKHTLRRITQKVSIWTIRMMDPTKYRHSAHMYESTALAICRKLAAKDSSILLLSPISGKRYIKSEDSQIYVIIESHLVTIVNHAYSYTIPIELKSHEQLIKMFDKEVETRRELMETEIRSNIKHSLATIYNSLVNE